MSTCEFDLVDGPTVCDLKQKKKERGPGSLQNRHIRERIHPAKNVVKEPSQKWNRNEKSAIFLKAKEESGRERTVNCADC